MIRTDTIENKDNSTVDNSVILSSKINRTINRNVIVDFIFEVDEQSEMRPDAISYAAYGTHDKIDIILKFNGISNPYSLKSGDILHIPNLNSYETALNIVDFKPILNQRTKIIDTNVSIGKIKTSNNNPNTLPNRRVEPTSPFSKSQDGILIF